MKRNFSSIAVALVAGLTIFSLTGCGSSGGSETRTGPPALINGFDASPSTIEAGSSSSLTPLFSGGSGVITPGNIAATSGTPVEVSPTTTTTYTLTVTPNGGTPATKEATVTVDPVPVISSFTAAPTTIAGGSSSSLTGDFTGGTGMITPGNISVTSGTPVSVSPTTSTTYMLTVTPPVGTVNATSQATVTVSSGAVTATITVDPGSPGGAVTDQLLGMNLAAWYDIDTNASSIVSAFQGAGIKAVRWPGGSWSDLYHWDGNNIGTNFNGNAFNCQNPPYGGGVPDSNDTFKNFVTDIVTPAGLDLALTADYGTNPACDGPGEPSEAAYWIQAAESYGINVSHITVGNEVYGSLGWEENLNNPTTVKEAATQYAAAMTGSSGFYASIAAAGAVQTPPPLIGVVVEADNLPPSENNAWDNIVLPNAAGSYDFVELHYYPQAPGSESDTYLTQQAAQGLTADINIVKSELANAHKSNTPIYVGEMGSVYSDPGKQSMSITQGLYAGQMLGEMMNDGVSRATWWIGFGNCNGTNGNLSSSLYGWQQFGAYNVFSDGSEDPTCMPWGTIGTTSPTAVAFQLFSNIAISGEYVLIPAVAGDTTDVRAYAATHSGGTALVVFNLNETTSQTVQVTLTGKSSSTDVKEYTYDKSIYDLSQTDVWNGPSTSDLGQQSLPLTVTVTPWSMNVLIIQ
ncbi:MAG TPA: hypothetical protein VMB66_09330 [Candidatus Acidoferrales bacterium]|nr:hypothetical protein [Candidatus Acidoferrales bacterium]